MICNMCMNYPTIHFVNDAIFSSRAERYFHVDVSMYIPLRIDYNRCLNVMTDCTSVNSIYSLSRAL